MNLNYLSDTEAVTVYTSLDYLAVFVIHFSEQYGLSTNLASTVYPVNHFMSRTSVVVSSSSILRSLPLMFRQSALGEFAYAELEQPTFMISLFFDFRTEKNYKLENTINYIPLL